MNALLFYTFMHCSTIQNCQNDLCIIYIDARRSQHIQTQLEALMFRFWHAFYTQWCCGVVRLAVRFIDIGMYLYYIFGEGVVTKG